MPYVDVEPKTKVFEKEGDFVEGILIAKEEKTDDMSSKYFLEAINPDGSISKLLVWGSVILDERMRFVKIGQRVRITFKGLGEKKDKKNAPKIFKVEVWREEGSEKNG